MENKINLSRAGVILLVSILAGCSGALTLSNVDYSQPVETVLETDSEGMVHDRENHINFSILPLQYAETQDTSTVITDEIRMIRGEKGYYYITAVNYQHVYIMAPEQKKLKLIKKVKVNENGLEEPAFNQRAPFIQLLDLSSGESYTISHKGLAESKAGDQNSSQTPKETDKGEQI